MLLDKTINDSDGYVRRCAAYALGLYGDKKAVPVLEKALEDKDPLVKNNAQAAITMLTELKDTEQK
jgi:HEAT repeat protein